MRVMLRVRPGISASCSDIRNPSRRGVRGRPCSIDPEGFVDSSREAYWRGKLSAFGVGPEPIEVRLAVRFRAMQVMSGLLAIIGLIFLAIFAGFGRPDVGLQLVSLL